MQHFGCDAPGPAQRHQFAVTVPAGRIDLHAKTLQHVESPYAHRADGRLRHLRYFECFFLLRAGVVRENRRGVDQISQLPGAGACSIVGEHSIRGSQSIEHVWKLAGEIAQHAGVLRALAGEQRGQLAGRWARAKSHSVGCAPRSFRRMLCQHRQRGIAQCRAIRLCRHHHHQAIPRRALELLPRRIGRAAEIEPRRIRF